MKKNILRLLALCLTVLLVTGSVIPVFAAADLKGNVPIVFVPGYMSSDIYKDGENPDAGLVWPPETSTILNAVSKSIPALAKYAVDGDEDSFCDTITPYVQEIFADAVLLPDGTAPASNSVGDFYPEPDAVEDGGIYTFRYDWRISPLAVAEQLDAFIDYICKCGKSKKVSVEAHSYGGVVLTTYVKLYGDAKLKNVVMNSTAVYGETFNGELLTGQIELNDESLTEYMKYTFTNSQYEDILNGTFALLRKAGLLGFVCDTGNDLIAKLSYRAIPEVIAPLFAGWLSIWSMIPDEYEEDAKDYVFNNVWKDATDREGLREKVESFDTEIRPYKTKVLKKLNRDTDLYVIARYGFSSMPLTPSYNTVTDGTIDLQYASFGATVAPYGEKLSDDYLKNADTAYISPDESIDVSTCLFPERTWFVRGVQHSYYGGDFAVLVETLLQSDETLTVNSLQNFPQFTVADGETLVPDEKEDTTPTGFFAKIKAFFAKMLDWFKNGLFR